MIKQSKVATKKNRFQSIKGKYNQAYKLSKEQVKKLRYESLERILVLNKFHPNP
jgi:hypothetical protein